MPDYATDVPLQPILVVLVYRGGDRFRRALDSIGPAEHHFRRIVVSITGAVESEDMTTVQKYLDDHELAGQPTKVEVICSEVELPTMEHQRFWINFLESTGVKPEEWVYWLAYDDQIRSKGIERIIDSGGNWPLKQGTIYYGPWAMRHEQATEVFPGPWDVPLESWTSFPLSEPNRLTVARWIGRQLRQPTYVQMSGGIATLESFQRVRDSRPRKRGPMRIEMAMAAAPNNTHVVEFPEPIVIIYGRSNSDRANYAKTARQEDIHLAAWLVQYCLRHPSAIGEFLRTFVSVTATYVKAVLKIGPLPSEQWVVRDMVQP